MEYAINTLTIELANIENVLRKQRALSCEIMSDHPDKEYYDNAKSQLLSAIEFIKIGENNEKD